MKIFLIGYGKMGKSIEQVAQERGHEVVGKLTSASKSKFFHLDSADVCLLFTPPDAVLPYIERVSGLGKPLVVGTTGWEHHLPLAKGFVEKNQTALLFGPNFSTGIYLFRKILKEASSLCKHFKGFALRGEEVHHTEKKEALSGTARQLIEDFAPHPLPFTSLRSGKNCGTHKIVFSSPQERVEFIHTAQNREGFSAGAIEAGEWILGKKRGVYI